MLTSKSMQNSVLSAEAAGASLRVRPCYECQIWNGFTSALRRCRLPLTWIWIFLFSRRSSSRLRAIMLWSVSAWHSYPISVSRILLVSSPVAFLLNFRVSVSGIRVSSTHYNGSIDQRSAFSSDPAFASDSASLRQHSTSTDFPFTYDQRLQ